jgi:hypothetical protein
MSLKVFLPHNFNAKLHTNLSDGNQTHAKDQLIVLARIKLNVQQIHTFNNPVLAQFSILTVQHFVKVSLET